MVRDPTFLISRYLFFIFLFLKDVARHKEPEHRSPFLFSYLQPAINARTRLKIENKERDPVDRSVDRGVSRVSRRR